MPKYAHLGLEQRLKIETCHRVRAGIFFQLAAIIFLGLVYGGGPEQSQNFIYLLVAAFVVLAIRGFFLYSFSNQTEKLLKNYHVPMSLSALTAALYGLFVADSIHHFHALNSQVMLCMFFITGMMTTVISALAAAKTYQTFYFLLCSAPFILSCFEPGLDPVFRNIGVVYTIYVAYLIYASRGISRDLIRAYTSEITSRQQTETLQKVIDLVPGFVAVSNPKGEWVTSSESFELYKNSPAFKEVSKQFRLGQVTHITREVTWNEKGAEQAYIISAQTFADLSMIMVGVPAEEIIEMRKELDEQRTKAEFSARLATLGEMAGGIAHEVNNPLAVIIGVCAQVTNLVNQPAPELAKIRDKIEKISKTSFRISRIIKGLQSFSRQSDKDPFVMTKLSHVLEETLELCRERFHHNSVKLEVDAAPDIELPMRAVQISQVLINLLNNGFDAVRKTHGSVHMGFELSATDLYITVSDSGPGIPGPIADRIFDPFFTTKEVGQGTGLGLSISRSILLDHHGEIHLVREARQTTFRIRLPLHESAPK